MPPTTEPTWVTVHTTSPHLPPSASRPHITTSRLLIRPLQPSDLDGLHKLRTQPEVMRWSSAGRVDADRQETAQTLARFLPPTDTHSFNCAVCWRETGHLIGIGGMHKREGAFGWPEIGYMFIREYWNMGLGTEFLKAFVPIWESLEREPVETRVHRMSLVGDDSLVEGPNTAPTAKEQLHAVVEATNTPSQRVLQKCRFDKFVEFEESHQQDAHNILTLHGYRWVPSVSSTSKTV